MRKAGARTLGQDEATCVVYGMPKVAFQIGAVETQAPLQSHCGRDRRAHHSKQGLTIMSAANKLEVMVVDDTSVSRMLMTESLQEIGITNLSFAKDGAQALDAADEAKPVHLVISDQYMPNLDGLGLLKALRGPPPTAEDRLHPRHRKRRQIAGRSRARRWASTTSSPSPSPPRPIRAAIEAVVGRST